MAVVVAENAAGDVALGVERDGVFIPIAQVSGVRIRHLVERGHDLAEKVEANVPEAVQVVEGDFVKVNAKGERPSTEDDNGTAKGGRS